MPDKRTIVQGQPFARCQAGGPATVEGGCINAKGACELCKNPMGRNETTCIGWARVLIGPPAAPLPLTWSLVRYGCVPNVDLYGDGRLGAHGGSGLSCIGGSIRAGEFMPGSPHVRHVLKVDVRLTYCSPGVRSCRWPSKRWPDCISPPNCTSKYATPLGTKEASLLAIPPKVAAALEPQLRTDLARRMLWTLTHFGAYVVDGE